MYRTTTCRCDDTRECVIQFCPPDDGHMCSKHVEAWNNLIIKFSVSSWLILRNKLYCKTDGMHHLLRLQRQFAQNVLVRTTWRLKFCACANLIKAPFQMGLKSLTNACSRSPQKIVFPSFDVEYIYGFVMLGVCTASRWRHRATIPAYRHACARNTVTL